VFLASLLNVSVDYVCDETVLVEFASLRCRLVLHYIYIFYGFSLCELRDREICLVNVLRMRQNARHILADGVKVVQLCATLCSSAAFA
jgi:hypothetical protein